MTPGRIQQVGSVIYSVGVLEPRIGGSTFWILPGVWGRVGGWYGLRSP